MDSLRQLSAEGNYNLFLHYEVSAQAKGTRRTVQVRGDL